MPGLYRKTDSKRHAVASKIASTEPYRSAWRRDYARLLHSASFRRLQGKTQVFPGVESDFFRNRLTHSLEVAQIAKSIAIKLNETHKLFKNKNKKIEPDLVEFAGLAHDLGHPPFGHNGEEALDECMRDHGGFEGNAQTLRILSRLEKKENALPATSEYIVFDQDGSDQRRGLGLTYRSLASVLKYDNPIPERSRDRENKEEVVKGYYRGDFELVKEIKRAVLGKYFRGKFKTIECSIMDIADDIAYSTYDLEDVFKSGFKKPLDLFVLPSNIYENVVKTINKRLKKQYPDHPNMKVNTSDIQEILHYVFVEELFEFGKNEYKLLKKRKMSAEAKKMYYAAQSQQASQTLAENGYYRTRFTSKLVEMALNGIEVKKHKKYPQLHQARLDVYTFIIVEVLKNITFETIIRAPALQVVEYRGRDIVKKIFEAIIKDGGERLLPDDFRETFCGGDELNRYRTACDFIAGMTDRYAIEFYTRLYGANGMTMHKPL
ncbi:dGTP triphosphohydrolase [Roseibium sp. HPY-6]|uniref:dGTP triphosphohydrolase n=1 Tax=Roseibium sp. HPY-6 TaxID=3229852 RepID=UPI00338D964E